MREARRKTCTTTRHFRERRGRPLKKIAGQASPVAFRANAMAALILSDRKQQDWTKEGPKALVVQRWPTDSTAS